VGTNGREGRKLFDMVGGITTLLLLSGKDCDEAISRAIMKGKTQKNWARAEMYSIPQKGLTNHHSNRIGDFTDTWAIGGGWETYKGQGVQRG